MLHRRNAFRRRTDSAPVEPSSTKTERRQARLIKSMDISTIGDEPEPSLESRADTQAHVLNGEPYSDSRNTTSSHVVSEQSCLTSLPFYDETNTCCSKLSSLTGSAGYIKIGGLRIPDTDSANSSTRSECSSFLFLNHSPVLRRDNERQFWKTGILWNARKSLKQKLSPSSSTHSSFICVRGNSIIHGTSVLEATKTTLDNFLPLSCHDIWTFPETNNYKSLPTSATSSFVQIAGPYQTANSDCDSECESSFMFVNGNLPKPLQNEVAFSQALLASDRSRKKPINVPLICPNCGHRLEVNTDIKKSKTNVEANVTTESLACVDLAFRDTIPFPVLEYQGQLDVSNVDLQVEDISSGLNRSETFVKGRFDHTEFLESETNDKPRDVDLKAEDIHSVNRSETVVKRQFDRRECLDRSHTYVKVSDCDEKTCVQSHVTTVESYFANAEECAPETDTIKTARITAGKDEDGDNSVESDNITAGINAGKDEDGDNSVESDNITAGITAGKGEDDNNSIESDNITDGITAGKDEDDNNSVESDNITAGIDRKSVV